MYGKMMGGNGGSESNSVHILLGHIDLFRHHLSRSMIRMQVNPGDMCKPEN